MCSDILVIRTFLILGMSVCTFKWFPTAFDSLSLHLGALLGKFGGFNFIWCILMTGSVFLDLHNAWHVCAHTQCVYVAPRAI